MDRIADLALLSPLDESKDSKVKTVQILDEWEHFTIKFNVSYPGQSYSLNQPFLRINGSRDELGAWNAGEGPQIMQLSEKAAIQHQNGQIYKPWQIYFRVWNNFQPNPDLQLPGQQLEIDYKYSSANPKDKSFEWERENRKIQLCHSIQYKGQLSSSSTFNISQRSNKKVWVVNGYLEIDDDTFKQPFRMTKIAGTNVSIGPYPSSYGDV